jgi:hypothetical protein
MATTDPLDRLSTAEVEAEFRNFSGADWKRALSLARMRVAGLSDWTPESLLGEALLKLQSGERVWRRGVHALVTLTVAMRSIASNERKKERNAPIDGGRSVDVGAGNVDDVDFSPALVQPEDHRDPAEIVDGRSQLAYIEKLVAGDKDAEEVLTAWSIGLRGKEAAKELGFEMNRYEAARKRLTDKLRLAADLRKTA